MLKLFTKIITNKSLFIPNYQLNNVNQLNTIQELINNKQVFIFDKDDTLVTLHKFKITNQNTIRLLDNLKQRGKQIYVVSNSVRDQGCKMSYIVNSQNQKEQYFQVMHTQNKKPFNGQQIQHIIQNSSQNKQRQYKLKSQKTVIIGDRLLTDIVLGNLMGWTTVYVKPIQKSVVSKHGFGVYVMRGIQNIVLNLF